MVFRNILIGLFVLIIANCSNVSDKKISNKEKNLLTPESLYLNGMDKFDDEKFEEALNIFKEIEKIFPLSNEAIQSQIMAGFIDYARLDYDSAIIKFTKLIKKYPSLKNLDYVYYMRALSFYEQINHEGLDGKYNSLALENLKQVINRFPDSKYAKDSNQKIILVKSNIAAKHMTIGRFYQKEGKFTAALNRYKIIINSFDETKFLPEALYRISEIYLTIGMKDESIKTAAILGHNYPQSEWYKLIYNQLNKIDNESIFSKTFKKIINE